MRKSLAIALALTFVLTAVSPALTMSSAVHGPTVAWKINLKAGPNPGEPSAPQVVDIKGKGTNEIVVTFGNTLYVLTAKGTIRWSYATDSNFTDAVAADLNGDGEKEIVAVTDSGFVHCLSADGMHLWSYNAGGSIRAAPAIADLNIDGKYEIIVGTILGDLVILNSQGTRTQLVQFHEPIDRPIMIGRRYFDSKPMILIVHSNKIDAIDSAGNSLYIIEADHISADLGLIYYDLNSAIDILVPGNSGLCVDVFWRDYVHALTRWCEQPIINVTSSPVIADIDQDGNPEFIVGTSNNELMMFRSDGTQGWQTSFNGNITGISAVQSPDMNILAITKNGQLKDLDSNGLKVWQKDLGIVTDRPAIAGDLNKDSEMEIVVVSTGGELLLLTTHQVLRTGWTLANHDLANTRNFGATELGEIQWAPKWEMDGTSMLSSKTVLADVNGDGKDEVFEVQSNGNISLFSGDGHLLENNMKATQFPMPPIAADINGDGSKEIIWAHDSKVEVLSQFLVNIWVYVLESVQAVAAGDLIGDGRSEVVVGNWTGRLVALRASDGVPLWSVDQGNRINSISIAGLGPNGTMYVITTDRNNVLTVRNGMNGSLIWSSSVLTGNPLNPVIGDFNGDGVLDVATATDDGELIAYSGNGTQLWKTYTPGISRGMVVIDGNETGQDLAISMNGTYDLIIVDGANGKILNTIHMNSYFKSPIIKVVAMYLGTTDPAVTGVIGPSNFVWTNRTSNPLNNLTFGTFAPSDVNFGDLDGNGVIDMVASSYTTNAYSLGVGPGPTVPWSMAGHDPEQTYNPFAKGGMIYPDLTIGPEDISFNPIVINGNITGNVTVTYHNQGPEPAKDFNITLSNGTSKLTTINVPYLAPFSQDTLQYQWPVKYANQTFSVALDSANVVKELRENNNNASRPLYKNEAPVAVAGPGLRSDPNKPVFFDGSKSHDPDDDIVSYLWDFGDGIKMKGPLGAHVFNKSGTYNVTLKVTDEFGAVGTAIRTVVVNHAPIFTDWKPKGDLTVNEGESIDMWTTVNDLDGDKVTVSWYLDKVKMAEGLTWSWWANYSSSGTHNLTASASDGSLVTNLTWVLKVIDSNRLIQDTTPPSPVTFPEGQSQQFTVILSPAAAGAVVDWYLDGHHVQAGTTTFGIFAGAGTAGHHDLKVQVASDKDLDFYTWNVTIGPKKEVPRIRWAFPNASSISTPFGTPVYLGISSEGGSVQWYIDNVSLVGENGQSFRFARWGNDSYTVTVMVSSKTATVSHQWTIKVNYPPTANIDASALTTKPSKKVSFDGTKSKAHKATDTITSYNWDFGDGTTDQGQQVKHSFKSAGGYKVTLTVTDSKGQTATSSVIIVVEPQQQASTPGFEGIVLVIGVAVAALAFRRRHA